MENTPDGGASAGRSLSIRIIEQGSGKVREAPSVLSNKPASDAEKAQGTVEDDLGHSRKQTFSGWMLLWLSFQSCGVIYGDIGTSPLYVFSSTFSSQPSWDDLVGALSIIIWSLTLIVSVKYVCIVLRADDDGQGGTFALYSLLARYARISRTQRPDAPRSGVGLERYLTNDMKPVSRSVRRFLESSVATQVLLKLVGILGVSMVMADGVLTPAQSVLGAIQGITVVRPDLGTPAIVGITCAILVLLFLVQPFGTARLGTTFAPIVVVWLLFNLSSGVYNLAVHDHSVLKAFSPHYAFAYLVRNGHEGWKSLGGLLLAFTGVEAMFADLGAFGKRAIQLSWLCLAYPCLLLAYIGQAAFISVDATGTAYTNPFYKTVPPGSFYFSMVIAVPAAIVASQAMITSTFQLLVQLMRLSYFPHVKVVHTSRIFHEQVYIPLANGLLLIGTVIVTAVYRNTTSLGNAYGVCVIFVTFLTTCMLGLVALIVWRLPVLLVLPVFLFFAALDGAFLSAALAKVPEGAWFTLLLSALISSTFVLWRFGKEAQWKAEARDHIPISALLATAADTASAKGTVVRLAGALGGATPISTVPGLGVFFDKTADFSQPPACFTHFVLKFAARPAVLVFFHIRPLDVPAVADDEGRYLVMRHPGSRRLLPNCYNVVLRHGYTEDPLRPGLAQDLIAQIDRALARQVSRQALSRQASAAGPSAGPSAAAAEADATSSNNVVDNTSTSDQFSSNMRSAQDVQDEIAALREACQSQTVYVLGKEAMRVDHHRGSRWNLLAFLRRMFLELFLWIRENSRTKLADINIETDKLIEVGFLAEL